MANPVTTTSMNDTVYAAVLEQDMQLELRPHRGFREFLRKGPAGPSLVFTFVTLDDSGNTLQSVSEASTDLISTPDTAASTTGTNATAAQKGVSALVSDLVKTVSIQDVSSVVTGLLARHMQEGYDVAAAGTIDNYANSTGGATANSLSRLLQVIGALEQRDVGSNGEHLMSIQHAKQITDLRTDVAGLTATFLAGNDARVAGVLMNSMDGYIGDPFGVPILMSNSIQNSGGAHLGWVGAQGAACGAYELWLEKIEIQRDASKLCDEVIASSAFGFALIDDNRIQGLKSTT